jgi:hypothetical protein
MAGAHCMSDAVLSVPGGRPWTWGSSAKSLSVITGRAWMGSAWTYGSKGWGSSPSGRIERSDRMAAR